MFSRCSVAILGCVLAVSAGRAETYLLNETVKPGDCFSVRLDMKLTGHMKVQRNGQTATLKLTASATHEFPERVLAVGVSGLPEKAARHYDSAKAVITVDGEPSERTLRPSRRLCVAQRHKDEVLLYCPTGSLTRDELDLTNDHFDTLYVTGILPGKAVAVGDTWPVRNVTTQALCNFEGLAKNELFGKLDGVKGTTATISVTGTAEGIDQGAMVKLSIKATATFDLSAPVSWA